jgi:pSer/pThr/pTyr-binding forkhead associated (FHA) protein
MCPERSLVFSLPTPLSDRGPRSLCSHSRPYSRNGTQVNGTSIGHHEQGPMFEDIPQEGHADYPLDDGDTLQIAGYEFQVDFEPALPCAASEPRDQERLWFYDCASC